MPNYKIQSFPLYTFQFEASKNYENSSNSQSHHLFDSYIFRNKINQNLSNVPASDDNRFISINSLPPSNLSIFSQQPNHQHLLIKFQTKILTDYLQIPYAYCSILMTNFSVNWIPNNNDQPYSLTIAFDIPVYTRIN